MQYTPNLNIPKPDLEDEFYQEDVNTAYDILDNTYGELIASETTRNNAETSRTNAENTRVANESTRVSNEATRVTTYNSIIKTATSVSNVVASSNIYTLDLNNALNFTIETLDTVAKSIAFANVPSGSNIMFSVSVKLKFTNVATITFPASVVWQDGAVPTFNAGKQYFISFITYDNGVTWLSNAVGEW